MQRRGLISTTAIYLAILLAVFSFTFWRLRSLAEGVSQEWFPQQDYYERRADAGPPKPFFSLITNRTYGTNERARVWINYHDVESLDFRVYRVNDPVKFFKQLDNPHQVGEDEESNFDDIYRKRQPTFLERVHAFKMGFYNWFRDYFRTQLRHDSRKSFNQKFRPEADDTVNRTPLNVADYARVPLLNPSQMVSSWREKLPPPENAYDRRMIPLGKREPGVYLIEAVNGDLRAYCIAMVTDLTMVEKTTHDGQVLVYAVNRQTGAPRGGVQVQIVKTKDTLVNGATDNKGIYRTKVVEKKPTNKQSAADESDEGDETATEVTQPSYLIMASDQANFAISDLDAFNYSSGGGDGEEGGDSSEIKSYIYTDRPVYRPNQKVYFKGILRKLTERGYQLPGGGKVNVTIEDPNSVKVYEKDVPLSSRGTFSGDLDLPEEAALGSYNLTVSVGDATASSSFEVEEYKKPEYKVKVTTPQQFVPVGQAAHFNVNALYFFGAPVTKADVKYYLYRERYYHYISDTEADPIDDFGVDDKSQETADEPSGDEGGYGDSLFKEGDGKLDANGNFSVDFTVPPPTEKEAWDYTYRLEAHVTDASRREMQDSAHFVGTRGTVVAEAQPEKYVYSEGETAKIKVKTADYEGHAVAAHVTLTFVEHTWEKIEKNDYGDVTYDYKIHERDLSVANVETNAQGEASYDYPVQSAGNIYIKTTVNQNGKQISFEGGYIWVVDRNNTSAMSDFSYGNESGIKLIPDKKSYKAGETAHILAMLPTDKAHLLVTTELKSVLNYREIDATGRAVMIDVKIEPSYAPNVFLNVTYVKDGDMYTNDQVLVVPPRDRLLKVDIISNKKEYKPRETISYTVLARNADGSPASGAEVSLGVVDEAIYSVAPETAGDIRQEFYGRRYNEVQTSLSVQYNFTGYAGKKPVQLAANRRAFQLADFKNEANLVQPLVRKIFKDTAYWQPNVVTGADGKATIKVDLPDNLTTWRATARAVTTDTRVGATTQKVLERKDVIIRLAMPRFLTAGDTVTLSGIVHNYLKDDKQTTIKIDVGSGARLLDPPQQVVSIPKNGEYRVNWRVSVPQSGQLTLVASALTDTDSDAVEMPMQIVPRGLKQTIGQATTLSKDEDDRTLSLNLPGNADPHGRTLRIEASPSLAGTLFGALDYLTGYPYGCTEQTMSQFLPTVIVANTLHEVKSASISDKNDINKKVRVGLNRLYKYQHEDGGWGWWKEDATDPYMTAYVIDGLTMASRAGYGVDDTRVEQGRNKLVMLIEAGKNDDGKAIDTETRAYMIYALSESNGVEARYVNDLFNNRGKLQPYGRALLALTLKQRGDETRARQVAAEIERTANVSDFDAHWESRRQPMLDFTEENNIEATSLSIKALAVLSPQSELLPKAARWLVINRKNGYYWASTKQTAFAIYGLTDYLKASQELSPNYSFEIYLNGEQTLTQQITSTEATSGQTFNIKRKDQEVGGSTQVRIVKHGAGTLYLSVTLDYATTEEQTASQNNAGIKLSRNYLRLYVSQDSDGNPSWKTETLSGDLHSGDLIVSRLSIEGNHGQYLMIEDPIPAGCEQVEQVGEYDLNYRTPNGWSDWYSSREFRDNRTVFFLNYFGGKATYQYAMRVQEPGEFRVAPARVQLMYQPNVQSNTASGSLKILDRQ